MLSQHIAGKRQAADIGHVLADLDHAVALQAGQNVVGVGLVDQLLRLLREGLGICGGPPVAHVALGVELAAHAVEAVRQLVADDGADAADIDREIQARVIHRRLQDRGGNLEAVELRVVGGVLGDRVGVLGGEFILDDGLAELLERAAVLEGGGRVDVRHEIGADLEPRRSRSNCRGSRPGRSARRPWPSPAARVASVSQSRDGMRALNAPTIWVISSAAPAFCSSVKTHRHRSG